MAIKRYIANADTTITNAFMPDLKTRGTGSNMGESDISEVFSIYGQQASSSVELSRVLTKFPIDKVITDRNNNDIPASGSVDFYLRLYNAKHSSTLPSNYTLVVAAVSQSWEEGKGLDMEDYSYKTYEGTGANWINASSGSAWRGEKATAVINCVAESSLNDTKDFAITDAAGTTTTYNISTGTSTSGNTTAYTPGTTTTVGMAGATTAADVATQIAAKINAGTAIGFSAAVTDSTNVTITQKTGGTAGNKTNTEPDGATGLTVGNFTGGSNTIGGNYHASPRFTQTFSGGDEDLEIDITHLVENWIDGENDGEGGANDGSDWRKLNYGVGVFLTSTQEAYSPISVDSAVIQNTTGSQVSYYTKKFFARGTEFWFKRPCLEARWDSSKKDEANNFKYWSPLAETGDNINTIYFYNYINGQLKNIPSSLLTNNTIFVSLYSGSHTELAPAGGKLTMKSSSYSGLGYTPIASTGLSDAFLNATGGLTTTTGIYSCSVAITGSDTSPLTKMYAVWHNKSMGNDRYDFHTSSVTPIVRKPSSVDPPSQNFVTKVTNLKNSYGRHENARFRIHVRDQNWNPNIYSKASTSIENKTIEDAYYRVFRVVDNLEVVPFGTGSATAPQVIGSGSVGSFTRLSYDMSGNYFDFDMSLLQPGYAYGIKLAYYANSTYREQPETFKFRVEES